MKTALTPELGFGLAVGVLLAWAILLQYGLYKQRAEERRCAADNHADNHANEHVVQALDAAKEGGVVENAPPLEGEAGGGGGHDDALLVAADIANGQSAANEFRAGKGVVPTELNGERPTVNAFEDLPVLAVHKDILPEGFQERAKKDPTHKE